MKQFVLLRPAESAADAKRKHQKAVAMGLIDADVKVAYRRDGTYRPVRKADKRVRGKV